MVRMQDIATRAGVAKGTVSAVLSGKEKKAGISSQTSARIRFIAEELGYEKHLNPVLRLRNIGIDNAI